MLGKITYASISKYRIGLFLNLAKVVCKVLKILFQCPPDEEINDFFANHVVDFYTRAKLVEVKDKRIIF